MKPRLLLVLMAGLLLAANTAQDDKEKALKEEIKKLEGSWNVVQMERGGEKLAEDKVKALNFQITFTDKKMTAKTGSATTEATYQLDPSKDPRTIDTTDKNNRVEKGIYKLDGDMLTICSGSTGGERPSDFKTRTGSEQMMFVLKKAK